MAKTGKLTAKQVESAGIGKIGDGAGLWLSVRVDSKAWIFRYKRGKSEHSMGLGSYPDTTLADARAKAQAARRLLLSGKDPINERRKLRVVVPTFRDAAESYISSHEAAWTEKHGKQWRATIKQHVNPVIGDLFVSEIGIPEMVKILKSIWSSTTETASRIRGRVEKILDWSTVQGFREGRNPARWKGNLDALLPARAKIQAVEHFRALDWQAVPGFMLELRKRDAMSAKCLEFAILTAARSGEVRGAKWSEFDIKAKLWTIPGERMKAGKIHRVPLSDQAIELLEVVPHIEDSDLVFFAPRGGEMSDMSLLMLLRRMKVPATAHGFRSSFKDWCSESTSYANEISEMALGHTIGDKTEAAYRRGDLLAKRTKMMQAWADHLDRGEAEAGDNVTSIRSASC